MQKNGRIYFYGILFLSIFLLKMLIAVAPVLLNFDKNLVNAAIMQLELENETKDSVKDNNKVFKKGIEFNHSFTPIVTDNVDILNYHYFSKKHLLLYFPAVPTPPPNHA